MGRLNYLISIFLKMSNYSFKTVPTKWKKNHKCMNWMSASLRAVCCFHALTCRSGVLETPNNPSGWMWAGVRLIYESFETCLCRTINKLDLTIQFANSTRLHTQCLFWHTVQPQSQGHVLGQYIKNPSWWFDLSAPINLFSGSYLYNSCMHQWTLYVCVCLKYAMHGLNCSELHCGWCIFPFGGVWYYFFHKPSGASFQT